MKNVFLDSNIFIQENYLQGKYINRLLRLGKDSTINLFIHDIVVGEVKSNFIKHLKESLTAYKQFQKSGAKYMRNVVIGKSIVTYEKLKTEELHREFCDALDNRLKEANVAFISYSETDVRLIFQQYFDKEPPFGLKEEKKHGFPDAFLIEFIKDWVEAEKENLTVLTSDNDFNHINGFKGYIDVQNDHRVFVDELNKEIIRAEELRIQKVDEIIYNDIESIKKETQEYVKDYLYDESIYYPLFINEIYDLSNLRFDDDIDLKTFIVDILNEEEIEVEISFKLKFKIDILTDDESMSVYDSEDKIMHYFDTVTIEVEGECEINTSVVLSVIDEEDYEEQVYLDLKKDDVSIDVFSKDEMYY